MGENTLFWTSLCKGVYEVCYVLFIYFFQPHLLEDHGLERMRMKVREMDILILCRNISRLGASEAKIRALFLAPQTGGGRPLLAMPHLQVGVLMVKAESLDRRSPPTADELYGHSGFRLRTL